MTDLTQPVTNAELQKVSVADRVTPADLEAAVAQEFYFTAKNGVDGADQEQFDKDLVGELQPFEPNKTPESLALLTLCVLVTRNGFTVVGKSACASPANFNPEIGKRIARGDAINQLWPLLGYELRTKLANQQK